MVRAALATKRGRLHAGPRAGAALIPAASVIIGSMMALLPIVSTAGWWPDFGLLMVLAWRLRRADCWPAWWAAPLGFMNDLLVGNPLGLSVALWAAVMIVLDVVDRRTMWRDYWIEWAVAALIIALAEIAQWRCAAIIGAPVPFQVSTAPAILIGVLTFPLAAWLVSRIDRWRLRR